MSAVTIDEAWPGFGVPFTVAELDRMPSDGHRSELVDGVLVVSPRPTTVHQFVAMRLATALDNACPAGLCVVPEPAVQLDPVTELAPDLVVVHLDDVGDAKFTTPSLLVDPEPARPELTVFELRDNGYVLQATSTQPLTVPQPFTVTITPADLTKGLLH